LLPHRIIWRDEVFLARLPAAEQRRKPQPTQPVYAPGSVEWFEAQKKKG
jgi:hypothetical protein